MRKIFRVVKGIVKGVRDVSPLPSREAEQVTKNEAKLHGTPAEAIAQMITSRGALIVVILYVVDELFKLGLFS